MILCQKPYKSTTEEIQIDSPLSTEEIIDSENEIFDNFELDERM